MSSATKKPKPPADTPQLEVAVEGSGITPEDLNIRQLSDLLAATSATIEAVATDAGAAPVLPSLKTIRRGSAEAVLWSTEPDWAEMIVGFYDVVATRGANASERVRAALSRLFRSVRIGAIRVSATSLPRQKALPRIVMAAPVEKKTPTLSTYSTTFYGKVVGVNQFADRIAVKIEHVDGGREEFNVDVATAGQAARLFDRLIRAEVDMTWDGQTGHAAVLHSLRAWSEGDLLESLTDVRRELQSRGLKFDVEAALRELEE